jgi:hypothetical protein
MPFITSASSTLDCVTLSPEEYNDVKQEPLWIPAWTSLIWTSLIMMRDKGHQRAISALVNASRRQADDAIMR